jgi:hypothetical protein
MDKFNSCLESNDFENAIIAYMNPYAVVHLTKDKIVEMGAFYTPEDIVNKVLELSSSYFHRQNAVVIDIAGGCGAFIFPLKQYGIKQYRVADCDITAVSFLRKNFDPEKVFYTNSLVNVSRKKFNVKEHDFLIVIGNPPYNDITSEYRKGKKGVFNCDEDLKDRDIGISFLKAFNKLKADVICVLHPLSYLIKEANFKRLKDFSKNYILQKGIIFPSSVFQQTGNTKFPVMIALYERNSEGMNFEYIKNFEFNVLHSDQTFVLAHYTTTDGYINKYPPRKGQQQKSPIGVYYYSFRDLNSVLRNASFITKRGENSIVVTVENFYKYAYLYCLKKLIPVKHKNIWIFGNLSPLIDIEFVEKNKHLFVQYALRTHKVFKDLPSTAKKIINYYNIDCSSSILRVEEKLKEFINALYGQLLGSDKGKA